jgi:hypothetical protein
VSFTDDNKTFHRIVDDLVRHDPRFRRRIRRLNRDRNIVGLNGAALALLNLALVSAVLRLNLALTVVATAAGVTFAAIALRRVLVHRARRTRHPSR